MGQLTIDNQVMQALEIADDETWGNGFFRITPVTMLYGAFWAEESPLEKFIEKVNGEGMAENEFEDAYYHMISDEQKKQYNVDCDMYELVMQGKNPKEAVEKVKKRREKKKEQDKEQDESEMTLDEAREKLADSVELVQQIITENILQDDDDDMTDVANVIRMNRDKTVTRIPNEGKIETSGALKVRSNYMMHFEEQLEGTTILEGDYFTIDFEDFTLTKFLNAEKDADSFEDIFYFNEAAFEILCKAILAMQHMRSEVLTFDHLMYAFFHTPLGIVRALFDKIYITKEELFEAFCTDKERLEEKQKGKNTLVIPSDIKPFVKSLTAEVLEKGKCIYGGREKEISEVYRILQKRTKKNAILLGDAGVGKTSIAKKIAWDIAKGKAPKIFKGKTVLSLDVAGSVAGTSYRGEAEANFIKVVEFLERHQDTILFIDEVHLVVGAGACREGEIDLANVLKPILAEGKTMVIGATTRHEYEEYFKKDSALVRRFNVVEVKEPRIYEVYGMLKKSITDLKAYHGINISKAMCEYIITMATCFKGEVHNPDRTIDLIDISMVVARELGKKSVDKAVVQEAMVEYYNKYAKMDDVEKRKVAYHEAGHYMFAKMMPTMQWVEPILVTIMPGDGYLGFTAVEVKEDVIESSEYSAYIEKLAYYLAGRAAEEEVFGEINSGASGDLDKANQIARAMVYEYAMTKSDNKVQVFKENGEYKMFSQKEIKKLNKQIAKVLNEAYDVAMKVIGDNRETLDTIAATLLEKGVATEKELSKIVDIGEYIGSSDTMSVVAKSGDDHLNK